jgi:hypothetical protein
MPSNIQAGPRGERNVKRDWSVALWARRGNLGGWDTDRGRGRWSRVGVGGEEAAIADER